MQQGSDKSSSPYFFPTTDGSADLFTLRFRAGKAGAFSLQMKDGLLVDKQLLTATF
ncbi:MAG: hypothetical protein II484_04350 [Bacteroidaceae bacterium]|nr:hypothetical protein [Bacteroidaceae bacterium]